MRYPAFVVLFFATVSCASATGAIVNPDAPDHVGAFHKRMHPYGQRILQGQTTRAMDQASGAMAEALDREPAGIPRH